ncbi:hypothetical protein [Clostridium ljungdahlii]|uniref:Uncharacterized protein n=1 Tax=Clostridium ljungdahlii TaxID=1538 RepID=A0A162KLX0_9CLOT|nr:hypothetical protein [Clostridium ljungdahlii]OAA84042.1 hypothetical protein WY13_03171 [Clostridium ljungdahlii]
MDFVNKSFPVIWKVLLVLVVAFILVRIVPFIVVAGTALFAFVKIKKYFRSKKSTSSKTENINNMVDDKEDPFNFSNKKVIDVEYDEIKK